MKGDSKAARLATELESRIRTEGLPPGDFLGTKATLAERYSVSGGTLNEVLRLLQVRGYIDVKSGPKGGAFVASRAKRATLTSELLEAQADPSHIASLFQVQDALEELVAVTAARRCSRDSAAGIGIALVQLVRASDPMAVLTASWALDAQIARATEDPILIDVYCGVLRGLEQTMEWLGIGDLKIEDTVRVHSDLAGAVMQNDVEAARRAARIHSPLAAGVDLPL
ncbi:MAG: hypothetical protein JWR01_2354 [Subtercola sp.]|nr:hypothetical protein [Subtercola sp.]